MRFFTPILVISFAILSIAAPTTGQDACAAKGCFTITSIEFYVPLKPKPDDNVSINFDVEAANDARDTCADDWPVGTTGGQKDYPSSPLSCANGVFSFYFDSFTSISEFSLQIKFTYATGTTTKTALGGVKVAASDLSCAPYLDSNRCQLAKKYSTTGLLVPVNKVS